MSRKCNVSNDDPNVFKNGYAISTLVISGIDVKPDGLNSPERANSIAVVAYDQSSLSGKSPLGLTTSTAKIQIIIKAKLPVTVWIN